MTSAAHSPRARIALLATAFTAVAALACAFAVASPLPTVTYYTSPGGTGDCAVSTSPCSLASALSKAEGHDDHGSTVTIDLAAGTYPPAVVAGGSEQSLTLAGAGPASTALSGEGHSRALNVSPGHRTATVTIENLTLEDGDESSGYGGDMYVGEVETLNLRDDTFTDGEAASGGGGIALLDEGVVNIVQSTFSGDAQHAVQVQKGSATLNISASTFTANPGDALTIGPKAADSTLDVEDSTITGNGEGAIAWNAPGRSAIYGSTISANTGGAALALHGGNKGTTELQLGGDVLSENESDCDLSEGTLVDDGYNLAGDETCDLTQPTSKSAVTPTELGLLELADNGGPTDTRRITDASVAHDAVPLGAQLGEKGPVLCAGDDQRGIARTQPGASACDAGAYQIAPPLLYESTIPSAEAGVTLHLIGLNLSDVSSVTFGAGATPGTITSLSASGLEVVVPNLPLGEQPITVTNADGSAHLPFTVIPGPSVTTGSLPGAVAGVAYSAQVQATGGLPPYTWSAKGLPLGLSMSEGGRISGTPLLRNSNTVTVTVTDQNKASASARLTLSVTGSSLTECVPSTVLRGLCASLVHRGTGLRPLLTDVSQSHRSWREGGALARISSTHKPTKHKPPIGTTYSFTLNAKATVTLTFARRVAGRMVAGKCVAPNHKNAKRRKCKRAVRAGELSFTAGAAIDRVRFQGRISRRHRLPLGSYLLTVLARNSAGSSRKTLSFTIVR